MFNDDKSKPQPDLFTTPEDPPEQDNSKAMEEFSRERSRKLRELSYKIKFLPGSLFCVREDDLPNESGRITDGDAMP